MTEAESKGEPYATTAMGVGGDSPLIVKDGEQEELPDPFLGRVLSGLYKIDERIGEGGMGAVYLATHVHLNKRFAVKVLTERMTTNKQAVDRLLMEAKLASSIEHDNIVDIVSFDSTDDGRVFIVMEYLKGQSLGDIVDEGRLPLTRALSITCQICDALQAAHDAKIIHRDLKPENIFVVNKYNGDFVKVLDFGISKVKTAEAEQVRMTATGQLVGTPLYMSPEQAKGEGDVDHRADIYAVGVILYELLTGTPPFDGGNYFQLLWKHGNEAPESPMDRAPDAEIPEHVSNAILKALSKERGERFDSMSEFAEVISNGVRMSNPARDSITRDFSTTSSSEVIAPSQNKSPLLWLALGTFAIATALGVYLMSGDSKPIVQPTVKEPIVEPKPALAPKDPPAEIEDAIPVVKVTQRVAVTSSPVGAKVHDGESVVCDATPCDIEVPKETIMLRLTKRGHIPQEISIEDGKVHAALKRRRGSKMGGMSILGKARGDF